MEIDFDALSGLAVLPYALSQSGHLLALRLPDNFPKRPVRQLPSSAVAAVKFVSIFLFNQRIQQLEV